MSAPAPAVGRYALVTEDCAVRFTARSLGLPVRGELSLRSGHVQVGDAGATVTAVLDAGSFRTRSARRDRDVRSPRFLDAARCPDMVFTGRWDGPGTPLAGDLAVKGVTGHVALDVTIEDGFGGPVVRARGRVDRRAFPVGPRRGPIGRWVDVELEVRPRPE
ncbi:MAG TPA: YceI family protein [Pseudonocardia sp.]|nr:YceI family protein [Pseudonocardia sp.]